MHFKYRISYLSWFIAWFLPIMLSALPQDLEIFTDFEDISGEGEFFIGEEPNRVKLVGFTVETLEDPALLHSGTKALTLGPGEEGRIVSDKGIQLIQFYAGESTGAGKIEFRGKINVDITGLGFEAITVIADNGSWKDCRPISAPAPIPYCKALSPTVTSSLIPPISIFSMG